MMESSVSCFLKLGCGGLFDCLKQYVNKHFVKALRKSPCGLMMESSVSCFLKLGCGRLFDCLKQHGNKHFAKALRKSPWGLMMESSVLCFLKLGEWEDVQLPEATWKQTLCQSSKEIPLWTYDGILCVMLLEAGGRGICSTA
jgi:hypothetical protein